MLLRLCRHGKALASCLSVSCRPARSRGTSRRSRSSRKCWQEELGSLQRRFQRRPASELVKTRRDQRLEWSILARRRCFPAQLSLQLAGVVAAAPARPVAPLCSYLAVFVRRRWAQRPAWSDPLHSSQLAFYPQLPPPLFPPKIAANTPERDA